jgi:hypothetical protein
LIPEDKVDVIAPINMLFIGGGDFLIHHEDRGWRILIPHGDIVDFYHNQHAVHRGVEQRPGWGEHVEFT